MERQRAYEAGTRTLCVTNDDFKVLPMPTVKGKVRMQERAIIRDMHDPCLTCPLEACNEKDERCYYAKPVQIKPRKEVKVKLNPTRREMVMAMVKESRNAR